MADTSSPEARESGALAAALKAIGTLLGVHVQYAQQEAKADLGRVVSGVVLLVGACLFALIALLVAHAAIVLQVSGALGNTPHPGALGDTAHPGALPADLVRAALWVAGGDALIVALLALLGRARLRRPILQQTRTLVRRTVTSLVEN